MNGVENMEKIKASLDYEIVYDPDFTLAYLDYLADKNVREYFVASGLDSFESKEEIFATYGQMIGSFVENADVLEKIADIILFYNEIVCTDDRLNQQVREAIEEPFFRWVSETDTTELAKKALDGTDLKPLLKGMTKRKWRK